MPNEKPELEPIDRPTAETRGRPRKGEARMFQPIRWVSVVVEHVECPACREVVDMRTRRTTKRKGTASRYWRCPLCRAEFVARGPVGEKPSILSGQRMSATHLNRNEKGTAYYGRNEH